jgi:hypothetical protein
MPAVRSSGGLDSQRSSSGSGSSVEGEDSPLNFPDSRVRRIGTNLPAEAIEANALQGVQIDALETARVDHVVLGVGTRTVEGGDTAVATEVMECTTRAELIRRKGFFSLHEMESISRYHVMKVAPTLADRAIAFAHPRKLGSNLELDTTAMARTSIGLHFAGGCHASPLSPNGQSERRGGAAFAPLDGSAFLVLIFNVRA